MKNKLKTIKKAVEVLMEADERCRNDDHWLVWRFIRDIQGINMFIPFEDFKKMASFESITRARRYIQNTDGKFLPTEETQVRRTRKELQHKEFARDQDVFNKIRKRKN